MLDRTGAEWALLREPVPCASLPDGHDPLNPDQLLPRYTPYHVSVEQGMIPFYERKRGHPLLLQLSGAGRTVPSAPVFSTALAGANWMYARSSPDTPSG
jgi:hypothetical protein